MISDMRQRHIDRGIETKTQRQTNRDRNRKIETHRIGQRQSKIGRETETYYVQRDKGQFPSSLVCE